MVNNNSPHAFPVFNQTSQYPLCIYFSLWLVNMIYFKNLLFIPNFAHLITVILQYSAT